MGVMSGRALAVVLFAVGGANLPSELFACGHERDCRSNPDPIEVASVPGYQQSRVRQINNRGDIVGQAVRASEEPTQQAVLWHKMRGTRYESEVLPPLEGLVRGEARGFATPSIPVGTSYILGGVSRAVAWRMDWAIGERVAVDLEPPSGFTDAQPFAGNEMGLIAGDASNPKELVDGLPVRHAVLWRLTGGGADVCDLGVPDGFLTSSANDVNTGGLVVGTALGRTATGSVVSAAFVWRPLGWHHGCRFEAIPLPSDPAAPTVLTPSINARGDVVARADGGVPAVSRALLWQNRGRGYADPEVLPLPEGFDSAFARAINARGDIVGTAQKRNAKGAISETHVVLWSKARRGWASRVLESPVDTTSINSEHLNDRGDVIADTTLAAPGSSGAYLWVNATRPQACGGHRLR